MLARTFTVKQPVAPPGHVAFVAAVPCKWWPALFWYPVAAHQTSETLQQLASVCTHQHTVSVLCRTHARLLFMQMPQLNAPGILLTCCALAQRVHKAKAKAPARICAGLDISAVLGM